MTPLKTGKICVSIAGHDLAMTLASAKEAESLADVLEIRLDAMADPAVQPFLDSINKPLLFTNRAKWEGGAFNGEEKSRLALLYEATEKGAAYIDLELKTDPGLRQDLIKTAKGKCRSIISWHSFKVTPSRQALNSILQEQYRTSADIGKIVTMAHNFSDVLQVLDLQREALEMGFPLIAFCMGRAGIISRVATLELGGFMTYAAQDSTNSTAPGQLPVSSLRNILAGLADAH